MFENVRADRAKHTTWLHPGLWALIVYRFGNWSLTFPERSVLRWVTSKIYGLLFVWATLTTGTALYRGMKIGRGFHIIHHGGIFIHPATEIGEDVGIMQGVTIGTNRGREGAPRIGNKVFIGAHAAVLGPVKVGEGAVIAANSLVITNVPPGVVAIGVPAKMMKLGLPAKKKAPEAAPAATAEVAP